MSATPRSLGHVNVTEKRLIGQKVGRHTVALYWYETDADEPRPGQKERDETAEYGRSKEHQNRTKGKV